MNLAANKIHRTVDADPEHYDQGNYNVYGEVRVEKIPNSGVFEKTLTMKLTPDVNDRVTFELQDGVSDYFPLTDFSPFANLGIQKTDDNQVQAQLWTGESYGDPAELQELSLRETFTVLNGGIPKESNIDFFNTYVPDKKNFLTWHPNFKRVDINQPELLHYYSFDDTVTGLILKAMLLFTDKTSSTHDIDTLEDVTLGGIYRIPAGFAQLGLSNLTEGKTPARYRLWLEDQDENIVSEVREYIIEHVSKPFTRYWMFTNSLGMWEIMRAEGKSSMEIEIDRELTTGYLQQGYDRTKGEIRTRVLGSTESMEVSTGFFSSKEEALWAKELLLSQKVFLLTESQRIPYNIVTSQYQPYEDTDYKWYLRFEVQLAYNNMKYGQI